MSDIGEFIIAGKALSELKVVELRKELETRNLPKSGNKKELYERLRNYLVSNYEESAEITPAAQPDSNNGYVNLTEYRSLCEVQPAHSTSPQKQDPENTVNQTLPIESENVVVAAPPNEQKQDVVSEQSVVEEESLPTMAQKADSVENSVVEEEEEQEEQIVMLEEPMEEQIVGPKCEQPSEEQEEEQVVESQQQDVGQKPSNVSEHDDEMQQTEPEEDGVDAQHEIEPSSGQDTVQPVPEEPEEANQQSATEEVLPANDELEDEEDEVSKDEKAADEELDYEEDVNENKSKLKVEHSSSPKPSPKEENENNNVSKVITESVVDKDVKPNLSNVKMYTPEGFVRRKEPSPARNKPSKFLHIRNLKRPFTTKILFEMLSAFGNVQENEFWIDNIKTNCIVKFETEEQAALARERLHNVVWPPSSDLSLIVEFSSEEKLARRRGDEVAPTTTTAATTSTATITSGGANEKLGLIVTVDNRKPDTDPTVRDKSNLRKRKASEEEPKKQLEDLFRKTVAQPPVYYLPLSEAEAEKRWAEKIRKEGVVSEDRRRNGDNGRSDERRRHGSGGGRVSLAAGTRHSRATPDRFKRARRDSPPPRRRR